MACSLFEWTRNCIQWPRRTTKIYRKGKVRDRSAQWRQKKDYWLTRWSCWRKLWDCLLYYNKRIKDDQCISTLGFQTLDWTRQVSARSNVFSNATHGKARVFCRASLRVMSHGSISMIWRQKPSQWYGRIHHHLHQRRLRSSSLFKSSWFLQTTVGSFCRMPSKKIRRSDDEG